MLQPTVHWGPALISNRKLLAHKPGFVVDPWSAKGYSSDHPNIILVRFYKHHPESYLVIE